MLLAAAIFGSGIAVEEGQEYLLQIDNDHSLFEPNAIVRYLFSTIKGTHSFNKSITAADEKLILLEETLLYNDLKQVPPSKLGQKTCEKLASNLTSNINVATIITFGALHALVIVLGKSALSEDLQVALWYQKFQGDSRVKAFVTKPSDFLVITAKEAAPSKATAPSKAAPPAKKPLESTRELPERTGEQNIAPGAEMFHPKGAILPKDGERNILITSALPYVNNVPHLGNIVGSVLSADIFSRYCKARNYNALYVCGTDEYGTATETKAIEEKCTPRELCDKYNALHKQVYDWFQIGFDYFGRTSTEKQTEIAQQIFLKLQDNGFLEEQSQEQLYCTEHGGFLADRFVEGTCPKCGYDDARGDQCDGCGNLLNPFELIKPRCKLDGSSPEVRETKHVFLLLDKLQPEVEAWNKEAQAKGNWSPNGKTITQVWLNEGLRPRAITRDLKWGTKVPLEQYKDKVLYVWFDACIGYVSITANYTDGWQRWWKDANDVNLYQFMGKDNVPFHTVVFPATEIGTRENWTKLHHLSTTEYLQYEGGKFSKSRNVGVFGNNAQEIGVSPSVWRYYLASMRPESSDSQFSWQDFVARNNNELLANLGNFVNRVIKFVNAKYKGVIPQFNPESLSNFDAFVDDVNKLLQNYVDALEGVHLKLGLEIAMQISARGNQFLQDNKIDNSLFINFPDKCDAVVGVALNLIYVLSAIIYPYMPETSSGITEQLNAPLRSIPDKFDIILKGGHNIGKAQYLFKRIDDAKVNEWKEKYGGNKK